MNKDNILYDDQLELPENASPSNDTEKEEIIIQETEEIIAVEEIQPETVNSTENSDTTPLSAEEDTEMPQVKWEKQEEAESTVEPELLLRGNARKSGRLSTTVCWPENYPCTTGSAMSRTTVALQKL